MLEPEAADADAASNATGDTLSYSEADRDAWDADLARWREAANFDLDAHLVELRANWDRTHPLSPTDPWTSSPDSNPVDLTTSPLHPRSTPPIHTPDPASPLRQPQFDLASLQQEEPQSSLTQSGNLWTMYSQLAMPACIRQLPEDQRIHFEQAVAGHRGSLGVRARSDLGCQFGLSCTEVDDAIKWLATQRHGTGWTIPAELESGQDNSQESTQARLAEHLQAQIEAMADGAISQSAVPLELFQGLLQHLPPVTSAGSRQAQERLQFDLLRGRARGASCPNSCIHSHMVRARMFVLCRTSKSAFDPPASPELFRNEWY